MSASRRWLIVAVVVSALMSSLLVGQAQAATAPGPAHSLAAAREGAAITKNSWQHAAVTSKSQQNWYRLTVPSRSYLYAMLGTLPANYNLRLYDESGRLLKTSDQAGTSPESIGRMVNAGTYFLRVASTKGYSASKKYDLLARVAPASDEIAVLTAKFGNYPTSTVVGELVNVSDGWLYADRLELAYYDAAGKRLRRFQYESPRPQVALDPGERAPFQVIPGSIPSSVFKRVKSVKVTKVWTGSASAGDAVDLKVSAVKKTRKSSRGEVSYDWSGKVTNPTGRKVSNVIVTVVARDKRGVVSGFDRQTGITLAAKGTKKFSLTYGNWRSGLAFSVKAYAETGYS